MCFSNEWKGSAFWDLALREHAAFNKTGVFDDALSSMFRNVDSRRGVELPVGDGKSAIKTLKARAVLVDMEPKAITAAMTSAKVLSAIASAARFMPCVVQKGGRFQYDEKRKFAKQSGSANNWAYG